VLDPVKHPRSRQPTEPSRLWARLVRSFMYGGTDVSTGLPFLGTFVHHPVDGHYAADDHSSRRLLLAVAQLRTQRGRRRRLWLDPVRGH